MKRFACAVLITILAFSLPVLAAPPIPRSTPLRVVTSFSILADMTRIFGPQLVDVTSLVVPDADAHVYQPTPEDAKTLAHADLIIVNGLGFDDWMSRLIESSGTKARVVVASNGVKPLTLDKEHKIVDPHAWQDPYNGKIYVMNIGSAIAQALPALNYPIHARAALYSQSLYNLDKNIREQFKGIPPAQRKIITSHNSFGYFGAAYKITFLAPVGISTEAEPSASDVAHLIKQIKSEGIKEVFIENFSNPKLIEQISHDTGAKLGGTLYSDALSSPDGPAPTYLGMFRNNVPKLKEAMLSNNP